MLYVFQNHLAMSSASHPPGLSITSTSVATTNRNNVTYRRYPAASWLAGVTLLQVLTGEWIAGMGMTEPGAGTDVLGMTSAAVPKGDHYLLNGAKTYITNGWEGHCFQVYAKVNNRISAFVIDKYASGKMALLPPPCSPPCM